MSLANIQDALCFDDVLLVPQHSEIATRSAVDISVDLRGLGRIVLPIISSPMDTVTGSRLAKRIAELGGLGIIHRYNTIDDQCSEVSNTAHTLGFPDLTHHAGAAVGITGDFIERASRLVESGANVICVDVAHGDHVTALSAIEKLRSVLGYSVHIMAGNVATREGFDRLVRAGADSVRVGIGGGSICSTRIQTGHGVPTLWSVMDCAASENAGTVSIIADGGIKTSGDIVKALAAGADAVMLGSLLSGTDETPEGTVLRIDGKTHKRYRGMASIEAQVEWRGHAASEEGVSAWVESKGSLEKVLASLEKGIRSGLSYSGATSISDLYAKAKFIRITSAGMHESRTHIHSK